MEAAAGHEAERDPGDVSPGVHRATGGLVGAEGDEVVEQFGDGHRGHRDAADVDPVGASDRELDVVVAVGDGPEREPGRAWGFGRHERRVHSGSQHARQTTSAL
jgi:hypothetical protein